MTLDALKVIGEAIDQADPIIDAVSEQVSEYLKHHSGELRNAAGTGDKVHKLVEDAAKRTGSGFLKRLTKWQPAQITRLVVTSALLATAPAPETKELFRMLEKSQAIAQQTSKSQGEEAKGELIGNYEREKEKLLSALERGLQDLDRELPEKLKASGVDPDSLAVWRAKRIFKSDLIQESECANIHRVINLGMMTVRSKEEREKIPEDFWTGVKNRFRLQPGEKLNLDDIADKDEEWRIRNGKSIDEFRAEKDYADFERVMLAIQQTDAFIRLKEVVGDEYGRMHLIEIAFLNNQATKEEQEAALAQLNESNMPLELLDELNPRLAV